MPHNKTKDGYIEKSKNITDFDRAGCGIAAVQVIQEIIELPYASNVLRAINCVHALNSAAAHADLWNYESAMNKGEGVLEITWDLDGARCGHSTITEYLAWNGKGDPLEKSNIS